MLRNVNYRNIDPLIQAAAVTALLLVFQLLVWLFQKAGIVEADPIQPWVKSATFLLVYALFNCVLSLFSSDKVKYLSRSITGFLIVMFLGIGMAYLFSGIWIDEAETMKWIYMVICIVYIIFLTIISLMRKIVEIALRQDRKMREEE